MASLLQNLKEIKLKALDATGSIIVITDMSYLDPPIVYYNDAFVDTTGYPCPKIVGFNKNEDNKQEELEIVKRPLKKGSAAKSSCRITKRHLILQ